VLKIRFARDHHPPLPLLELCRRESVTALFSLFDPDIHVLSSHRAELSAAGVLPVVCSHEVSEICFDKFNTNTFLEDNGLPVAPLFASAGEARRAVEGGRVRFPLMVKERRGFGSRSLRRVVDLEELESTMRPGADLVAQEYVNGTEYGLDILNDLAGRPLAAVAKMKVAMRAGETDQAVTVDDAALEELGLRLGALLGQPGPADVDVVVRDGQPYVLDINPRFGGGYPASHLAGADFPCALVEMIRGRQPAVLPRPRAGVAMMKTVVPVQAPPECAACALKDAGPRS
jgi:carbamoyl-phosphate synthase large subunit